MKNNNVITLRPHHALCIRFFSGHGYSPDFTQKMIKTIESLQKGTPVTFTDSLDDLCSACPNNLSPLGKNICTSEKKVMCYDQKVREECGFTKGYTDTWNNIYDTVTKKIMESNKFDTICNDCSWRELCHTSKTTDKN